VERNRKRLKLLEDVDGLSKLSAIVRQLKMFMAE
jgi:hypothetical protein